MKYTLDKNGNTIAEPETAEEWCIFIRELSIDYDGYRTPKGLMELIDELSECAGKAIECIKQKKYS